ncbi:MAG: hypothetical protein EHM75_09770, partial [Desulfobacteraceae bacterium]
MDLKGFRLMLAVFLAVLPTAAFSDQSSVPPQSLSSSQDWWLSSNGMYGGTITALAVSPNFTGDQTLLAGTSSGGVFKSTDGGAQWRAVNTGLGDTQMKALAYSPSYGVDKTVFSAALHGGIKKSTNGGESWEWLGSASNGHAYCLGISPQYASDSTLFGGVSGVGVYRTTNGGTAWDLVNTNLTNL